MIRRLTIHYPGLLLLAGLLLGGGTQQKLWSDYLVLLLALPACAMGWWRLPVLPVSGAVKALCVGLIVLIGWQFAPFSPPRLTGVIEGGIAGMLFTLDVGRSAFSALYIIMLTGVALFIAGLSVERQYALVRFLIIGLFINIVVGLLQMASSSSGGSIAGIMPFVMRMGVFANENHQSTLVAMMVPLIVHRNLVGASHPFRLSLILLGLVVYLFAVGSHAGMGLAVAMTALSLAWFVPVGPDRLRRFTVILVGLAGGVALLFLIDVSQVLQVDGRGTIFATTIRAATDAFPWGTGLGTFVEVYPAYEALRDIRQEYVNHAHNDYLEIALELSVAGIALLLAFLGLFALHGFRSAYTQAAALSMTAVLLHSIVDYPLRTLAVAMPFAMCVGVVFGGLHSRGREHKTFAYAAHDVAVASPFSSFAEPDDTLKKVG